MICMCFLSMLSSRRRDVFFLAPLHLGTSFDLGRHDVWNSNLILGVQRSLLGKHHLGNRPSKMVPRDMMFPFVEFGFVFPGLFSNPEFLVSIFKSTSPCNGSPSKGLRCPRRSSWLLQMPASFGCVIVHIGKTATMQTFRNHVIV